MYADGSVSGQWEDVLRDKIGRIHIAVDCLQILDPGNIAIIGGVVTKGIVNGQDLSGQRALTAVVDNGKSANDPPDQISLTIFATDDCSLLTLDDFTDLLFDLTNGQVIVR